MLIEASPIKPQIKHVLETPHGIIYFCEHFVLSEFNEGVLVDFETILPIINEAKRHYGHDAKIAYISNRVNSYSINLLDCQRLYKEQDTIISIAIVNSRTLGLDSVLLERSFVSCKVKKFSSLQLAMSWSKRNVTAHITTTATNLEQIA